MDKFNFINVHIGYLPHFNQYTLMVFVNQSFTNPFHYKQYFQNLNCNLIPPFILLLYPFNLLFLNLSYLNYLFLAFLRFILSSFDILE